MADALALGASGQWLAPTGPATFEGQVAHRAEPNVAHRIRITVHANLAVTGTSMWPADPLRALPERSFALRGSLAARGRIELVDDAPERLPGFRRGIYDGGLDPASGCLSGQYYELSEHTHELFYWGDWRATR